MKLKELADLIGGRIAGDPDVNITGADELKDAKQDDITFLADRKHLIHAQDTKASAIIVQEELKGISAQMLIVDNPRLAFARALEILYKKTFQPIGVSRDARIGSGVKFGEDISVFPLAYVSNEVRIGNRVIIYPGVFIGDNVSIGDDSVIYPNAIIREDVKLGKNVVIHSGSVIGADGFGYVQDNGRHHKVPQVGDVLIEDDVEIGANVTIDKATVGSTIIGSGTKIDNLVQIAHNVKIGRGCLIVGQVGISGSVEIGDGVVLGGQVGVRDHIRIGSGAMVGAQAGIGRDIPDRQIYSGSPAIPHKTWMRAQSIYSKLPEYIRRLQELEGKMKLFESKKEE